MNIISQNFPGLNSLYQIIISLIDITIVAILIYAILVIVQNNVKTMRIFKGVIIVIVVDLIAKYVGLTSLQTITQNLINWGFLVFVIIFQPEIRSFLEKIGKTSSFSSSLKDLDINDKIIDEIVSATLYLAQTKTGALITFERNVSLNEYISEGIILDAEISKELIKTIFKDNTALHDGAIIIQGNRIACASTYYPPPSIEVVQSFGARHRAAIGISEITDCLTIVVSEETGDIRLVQYGQADKISPSDLKYEFIKYLTSSNQEMDESEDDLDGK